MSSDITVTEVETGRHLDRFIKLPFALYRGDSNWVPPLISERRDFFNKNKNPFFRGARTKLFLVSRAGTDIGRIATCINFNHNDFHDERVGFFGFFDCVDDFEVASRLLKVAMITIKSEGMDKMRGPADFSTNHEVGFLIEGFDQPPAVMMPYNPPYLPRLAERFGLKKVMDMYAFLLTDEEAIPERQMKIVNRIRERSKIRIRSADFGRLDQEIKVIRQVYNRAWERNWGFVPMREDEFYHMGRALKDIADPELVLIAEIDSEPVAFAMGIPNINEVLIGMNGRLFPTGIFKLLWNMKIRRKIRGIRVMTLGVVDKYRRRGIDNILYAELYERGIRRGYRWAEMSWVLETNELMCRAASNMGGRIYKKYRMVEMPI